MTYVDGFVATVPDDKREYYAEFADKVAPIFVKHGALATTDCWGDDVPDGVVTSFPMAVKAEPGETVVFGWVTWPSKQARDEGMAKVMEEADALGMEMPFDGKRAIFGGFEPVSAIGGDDPAKVKAKTRTCFWFDSNGEEAAEFYVSLLPDSYIETISRPGDDGQALVIEFTLAGTPYMILNGGPMFQPTPAASIGVLAKDQAEIDMLWEKLTRDGGKEGQCGWVVDRFGISWQIAPEVLPEMMMSDDKEAAGRARDAMMQMTKFDIAKLESAFRGG